MNIYDMIRAMPARIIDFSTTHPAVLVFVAAGLVFAAAAALVHHHGRK
jgi:hypothetical protein